MSIETEIAGLKKRKEAAERKHYLNEHQLKAAQADFEKAQEVLREEFGVASVEEAKKLIAEMEEQIQAEVAKAEASLAVYEEK